MSQQDPTASKPRPSPSWGGVTLSRVLDKWAQSRPETVFLRPFGGIPLTFAETHTEVDRLARLLHGHGFGPGDSILLRAGRRPEGFLLLLAATRIGMNVCIAPESWSARQISEGAVSYAPKLAVDAGLMPAGSLESLRIMEAAANLFTIRMVGCFGAAPDGLVDFSTGDGSQDADLPTPDPELDGQVHILQHNAVGKLERMTRSQSQLLAQAMACAMVSDLTSTSIVGTAHDPLGAHGLLASLLPALLVGCGVQLFEAIDPKLDARIQLWQRESRSHHCVLPAPFARAEGFEKDAPNLRRVWICADEDGTSLPKGEAVLVDCAGTALLPAKRGRDGQAILRPGAITVAPTRGGAMSFGALRLEGSAQENSTAGSLMSGEIFIEGPLAASRNGKLSEPQPSGQFARLIEDEERRPVYSLLEKDATAIRVGSHRVVLAAVNRALGLTGRWQDAAVFSVPDPILHNRIEVAVEPRVGDNEAHTLPTLDLVRSMLRDSGVGDAGLPVRLHLVTRVPRRGRGQVDVAALPDHAFEIEKAQSARESEDRQVVA